MVVRADSSVEIYGGNAINTAYWYTAVLQRGGSSDPCITDEPVALVLYCLTHPLRGWDTVDESRQETADRMTRYQTDC